MAVLFMDSPTSREGAWKWDEWGSATSYTTGTTPAAGDGMRLAANTNAYAIKLLNPAVTSLMVSFLARIDAWGDGASLNQIFAMRSGTSTVQVSLSQSSDGRVVFRRNVGTGTVITQSDPGVIGLSAWHHYEIRLVVDDTTGILQCWVDGELVVDFTGDTSNGGTVDLTSIRFGRTASGSWDVADIVIRDATTPLGVTRVYPLLPNADGTYSAFTPSTGTDHYALVDEVPPNEDTDYVAADTEGEKDSYAIEDMPAGTWDIKAVQVSAVARRFDAGTKYLRPFIRTGATDFNGDSKVLSEQYESNFYVWDQNPDTATDWTESDVDGLEVGVEVRDS